MIPPTEALDRLGVSPRRGALLTLAFVLVGATLRIVQWAGSPSLWLDELMLVKSVRGRGLFALLFTGLEDNQVASPAYLLLTKASTLVFGEGDLALRLVPLCASLVALVLFARLAPALLAPLGALVVTAGFALSPMLISLGGVVKPYATDVLATVLVLVAYLALKRPPRTQKTRFAVAGAAGAIGFLSTPSVLVACAALVVLLARPWAARVPASNETRMRALAPLGVWAGVAGLAALAAHAVLTPETERFMVDYWAGVGAFAPSFLEYPTWVLDRWRDQVQAGLLFSGYGGPVGDVGAALGGLAGIGVLVGVLLVATVALARSGVDLLVLALLPCLLALVLSRLEVYPMDARTWAFLLPLLLLCAGAVAAFLASLVPRSQTWAGPVVAGAAIALQGAVLVDHPPPYVVQREREVVAELARRRSAGEPVFAYLWAEPALSYYGERFGVGEPVAYGDDVPTLRAFADHAFADQRVLWLLFTHANPRRRDYLLCYMDEIGREAERVVLPGGVLGNPVSLHRYELALGAPASAPRAAPFPPADVAFQGEAPRCRPRDWSVEER